MNKLNILYAFLGGAIAGAGAALLFAPEKGEELRSRIKELLHKKGLCCCDSEVDELIDEISEAAQK